MGLEKDHPEQRFDPSATASLPSSISPTHKPSRPSVLLHKEVLERKPLDLKNTESNNREGIEQQNISTEKHLLDESPVLNETARRRIGIAQLFTSRFVTYFCYGLVVIAISFLLRTFVVQGMYVPSSSMAPTIKQNDHIVVEMVSGVQRGDIIAFYDPDGWLEYLQKQNNDSIVLKRVIGVEGDHISCAGSNAPLEINGVEIKEPYLNSVNASNIAFDVVVPKGYYWVMGDNREHSADSRVHQNDKHNGFVPAKNVIGRAVAVYYPFKHAHFLSDGRKTFSSLNKQ